jgi:putative membrane protein
MHYLQGLSAFAGFFAMGLGCLFAYVLAYLYLTPQRELALIREGNIAAAVALAGATLGFALPLASALASAVNTLDLATWAVIGALGQGAAYLAVRLLLPAFPARITRGELAAALLSASLHIGVGLINAAAMSY